MIGPFRSIGEYSNPLYLYHGSLKSIYLDIFTQELWFFSLHLFSNCFSFSCGVLHHCIPNPFHSVTRHQNSFFASTFTCSVTDVGIEKGSRTTIHSKIFQSTILSICDLPFQRPRSAAICFSIIIPGDQVCGDCHCDHYSTKSYRWSYQHRTKTIMVIRNTRPPPPRPGPGKNSCPGPENFQDCPASPRVWLLPHPAPKVLLPAPPCPPRNLFLLPRPAKKRLPVHPWCWRSWWWGPWRPWWSWRWWLQVLLAVEPKELSQHLSRTRTIPPVGG